MSSHGKGRPTGLNFQKLLDKLRRMPTPCDNCPNRDRCSSEGLACNDWAHYVATGRIRRHHRRVPIAGLLERIERADRDREAREFRSYAGAIA